MLFRPSAWCAVLALGGLAACGSGGPEGSTSLSGGDASETSDSGESSGPASTGDTSGESSAGPIFDVGANSEGTSGPSGDGCKGVDFLFVIDNSGSMGNHQQELIQSVPGFISTIENTLGLDDFQILVTSTEPSFIMPKCEQQCMEGPICDLSDVDVPCSEIPFNNDPCETTLGVGRTQQWPWVECGVEGGNRYLTDAQTDLAGTYGCIASVGTEGDGTERPMGAMVNATGLLSEAGACNEGFIRDEAILVVTFITDEAGDPEMGGPNEPDGWRQALLDAKHGAEEGIVVLGIMADNDWPNPLCEEFQGYPAPRLEAFVQLWGDHGLLESVCAPDYTPFFEEAVGVIDLSCEEYDPPG